MLLQLLAAELAALTFEQQRLDQGEVHAAATARGDQMGIGAAAADQLQQLLINLAGPLEISAGAAIEADAAGVEQQGQQLG